MNKLLGLLASCCLVTSLHASNFIEKFKALEQINKWDRVAQKELKFKTFHPQGMYIIGNKVYLSSVEIIEKPERFDKPQPSGIDRDKGSGKAHLFVFDINTGNLIKEKDITSGEFYHPGGLDFDGKQIWTAISQYRPYSESKIITINPETLEVKEQFTVKDHIGAVIYDRENQTMLGLNWGGRDYYKWKQDPKSSKWNQVSKSTNPNLYIDYQDCQFIESHRAVCFGLAKFKLHLLSSTAIGGTELIDTENMRPDFQVPVLEWLKPYLTMTNNPSFVQLEANELVFYFIPEDDDSTLYKYKSVPRFE